MTSPRFGTLAAPVVLAVCVLGVSTFRGGPAAQAQQSGARPPGQPSSLSIVAVDVQPANPGPDTLCRLRIRLRNAGKDAASELAFEVTVNGQRLPNFMNHTWMTALSPGQETDVQVFNFWSSETGRPFPDSGRLTIEVRLTGARWMDQKTTSASARGGGVQPLPGPFTVTLAPSAKR